MSLSSIPPEQINLSQLRQQIVAAFDEEELRTLYFEAGVGYDEVPGQGTAAKARELVQYFQRQRDLAPLLAAVRAARPQLDWGRLLAVRPGDDASPFKGLRYFDEVDAPLFFGREEQTAKLMNHLRHHRFLAVVGASGSGKSSLVRAGLVYTLRNGRVLPDGSEPPAGSSQWLIYIITPTATPLAALASSLTRDSESVTAAATLIDDLAADRRSLSLYALKLKEGARPSAPFSSLLLIIDQFEELFTQCHDEAARRAFVDNLVTAAASSSPLLIIIGLRADFYGHCLQYGELHELLEEQQKIVPPMTAVELRQAIELPAQQQGLTFEPGLVDLLLQEVRDEPGALPLLSHALLETWKRREGSTMTLAGYQAAGGVRGAIAKTADSTYARLSSEEQSIARSIFLRLTELGEGTQDTRRRAGLAELMLPTAGRELVAQVLNILADARLVTTSEDAVEVSHEVLIREWPALRQWLNENREAIRVHRQLTEAANDWVRLGRDAGALYRGARLQQAREWSEEAEADLNPLEREFLQASLAWQQDELVLAEARAEREQEAASKLRQRAIFLRGALVLAALLTVAMLLFWQRSVQKEQEALDNAALALTREAEAQQALAQVEQQRRMAQAGELAGLAEDYRAQDYVQSLLLAREAVAVTYLADGVYTPKAQQVLYEALAVAQPRLVQRIGDGNGFLSRVAYSPDGSRLATAGCLRFTLDDGCEEGRVQMWTAVGDLLAERVGLPQDVSDIAFSPDGSRLLVRQGFGLAVSLWDFDKGQWYDLGQSADLTTGWFAFNGTGTRLLTADEDGLVRLWDGDGHLLAELNQHGVWAASPSFSPDGTRILTRGCDELAGDSSTCVAGSAWLWDGEGRPLLNFASENGHVSGAFFSPDGRQIATSGCAVQDAALGCAAGQARLWTAEGEVITSFALHNSWLNVVGFSPDGSRLLTVGDVNELRLWDGQGELVATLSGPEGYQHSAWNGDSSRLVIAGGLETSAFLWDRDGVRLAALDIEGAFVEDLQFDPTGQRLLVMGDILEIEAESVENRPLVRLWDSDGHLIADLPDHELPVHQGSFSPDGATVATTDGDGTAHLYDLSDSFYRQFLGALSGHEERVVTVSFSDDGQLMASGGWDGRLIIWDTGMWTGEVVQLPEWRVVAGGRFSPDGERLVAVDCSAGCRAWLFDERWQLIDELAGYAGHAFRFLPEDGRILSSNEDGEVLVWDRDGNPLPSLSAHEGAVSVINLSDDGRFLVTAGEDGTARLWQLDNLAAVAELAGHEGAVLGARFHGDGSRIVTHGDDETVRVWDTAGNLLLTLSGHSSPVTYAAFNRGPGNRIVSQDEAGEVRLWTTAGELVATLGSHTQFIDSVSFNHKGSQLVTLDCDVVDEDDFCTQQAVRLWDSEGNQISQLFSEKAIAWVEFSPDDRMLVAAGCARLDEFDLFCEAGGIWRWRLYPTIEDMLLAAEQRAGRGLTTAECQQFLRLESCPQ
jgi:WD40 repeat protein